MLRLQRYLSRRAHPLRQCDSSKARLPYALAIEALLNGLPAAWWYGRDCERGGFPRAPGARLLLWDLLLFPFVLMIHFSHPSSFREPVSSK